MGNISPAIIIVHVGANLCVERNALVYRTVLAVKNIVGAQKAVKTAFVGATVQRVNAEVGNAHALLPDENVIQTFAAIVGLAVEMGH